MTQFEQLLKEINERSVSSYNYVRTIGRACILIKEMNSSKSWVLKYSPPVVNTLHFIWRKLMKGSLPFQNEFRMLDEISKQEGLLFEVPAITDFEKNRYYIANYIDAIRKENITLLDSYEKNRLAEALLDIRRIKRPKYFGFIKERVFRLLESPTRRVLMDLAAIRRTRKIKIRKIVKLILRLEVQRITSRRKLTPGIIHNDMGINNILIDKGSKVFLIDWEDSKWESKWPLIDITDIALNLTNAEVDGPIVIAYIKGFMERNPRVTERLLQTHFTFSFLRSLLRALRLKRVTEDEKVVLRKKLSWFVSDSCIVDDWFKDLLKKCHYEEQ